MLVVNSFHIDQKVILSVDNRPFSYFKKESGLSVIFIHFHTRSSI